MGFKRELGRGVNRELGVWLFGLPKEDVRGGKGKWKHSAISCSIAVWGGNAWWGRNEPQATPGQFSQRRSGNINGAYMR